MPAAPAPHEQAQPDGLTVRYAHGPGPRPLWSLPDTAGYLGVPVKTLYTWRSTGYGPRGFRVGKYVRYRPEDVDAWLATQADDAEGEGR